MIRHVTFGYLISMISSCKNIHASNATTIQRRWTKSRGPRCQGLKFVNEKTSMYFLLSARHPQHTLVSQDFREKARNKSRFSAIEILELKAILSYQKCAETNVICESTSKFSLSRRDGNGGEERDKNSASGSDKNNPILD